MKVPSSNSEEAGQSNIWLDVLHILVKPSVTVAVLTSTTQHPCRQARIGDGRAAGRQQRARDPAPTSYPAAPILVLASTSLLSNATTYQYPSEIWLERNIGLRRGGLGERKGEDPRRSGWHIPRPVAVSLRWGWGPMCSCGGGGRRTDAVGHQRSGATADQSHNTPMRDAAVQQRRVRFHRRRAGKITGGKRLQPWSSALHHRCSHPSVTEDREAQPSAGTSQEPRGRMVACSRSFTQAADDDAHPQEGATTIGETEEERRRRRCSIPMVLLRRRPASSW